MKVFNKVQIFLLFTLITVTSSCSDKIKLEYDKNDHSVREVNDNIIRQLTIMENNPDGSVGCEMYFYEKETGTSFINIENPDTSLYLVSNNLGCKMKKGKTYFLKLSFLGRLDSLKITW